MENSIARDVAAILSIAVGAIGMLAESQLGAIS